MTALRVLAARIHGLVRDETFAIAKTGTELVASLEWDDRHPVYEGFPWEGKLTTTFRAISRGLEIHWSYENRADSPAPAGVSPRRSTRMTSKGGTSEKRGTRYAP